MDVHDKAKILEWLHRSHTERDATQAACRFGVPWQDCENYLEELTAKGIVNRTWPGGRGLHPAYKLDRG